MPRFPSNLPLAGPQGKTALAPARGEGLRKNSRHGGTYSC